MNRSGSASGGYSSGLEAAYHNYGMDMESWKSDKYSHSHGRYKVGGQDGPALCSALTFPYLQRGSSSSSGGGTHTGTSGYGGGGASSPYQSGLYDSWKTEWNPTYRDYQTTHYPYPTSSYMTKGGRR